MLCHLEHVKNDVKKVPSVVELNFPISILPPKAHILKPFFRKTVFFSKIFFGKPPSKFLEVCLKSKFGIYVKMKSSYNFNGARALKKLISAGVEVTSTLPNSDTQKDLLM
jgi:hypothetical protein